MHHFYKTYANIITLISTNQNPLLQNRSFLLTSNSKKGIPIFAIEINENESRKQFAKRQFTPKKSS